MSYSELLKQNADPTEIQEYLVNGKMTAVTVRIPQNLRDSAKEAAALKGMSFSTLVRMCLIDALTRMGE